MHDPNALNRLEFEQWANENPIRGETNLFRYPDGRYASPDTGIAWSAWQAAELRTLAAQSATPAARAVPENSEALAKEMMALSDKAGSAGETDISDTWCAASLIVSRLARTTPQHAGPAVDDAMVERALAEWFADESGRDDGPETSWAAVQKEYEDGGENFRVGMRAALTAALAQPADADADGVK